MTDQTVQQHPQTATVQTHRGPVTVTIGRGLPDFSSPHLGDLGKREVREIVRAALLNQGFEYPLSPINVELPDWLIGGTTTWVVAYAVSAALLVASEQVSAPGHVLTTRRLSLNGSELAWLSATDPHETDHTWVDDSTGHCRTCGAPSADQEAREAGEAVSR